MSITHAVRGALVLLTASLAIGFSGSQQVAVARDDAPTCGAGTGPMCKAVTKEVCLRWAASSISLGLTSFGGGLMCEMWEKTTTYYYYETSSGGTAPKPGLF